VAYLGLATVLQGSVAYLGLATVCYRSIGISRFSYCVFQGPITYLGLATVLQDSVAYLGLASACYNVQWRLHVSGRVGRVVTMPISKKNYDL
jgi:hypothetical protein